MQNNLKKASNIYFNLFDLLMLYNHKIWKSTVHPLPLNHLIVIFYLRNNGTSTISEIAHHLSISKQQMSPIIDKLTKKEFIERKNLTNDRRYSQINISKKGIRFLENHRKKAKDNFIEHITNLTDDDIVVFDQSVKNIEEMLNKMFKKMHKID